MKALCLLLLFIVTSSACAEYVTPAVDFFMHDREFESFLRDHFRFEEAKPFRIEYSYITWLKSPAPAEEYRDYLHLETSLPVYNSERLMIDLPIQYSRVPLWTEKGEYQYGNSINILFSNIMIRWITTDRLRSIAGFEYNLKGDSEYFNKPDGRMICPIKTIVSYDLHKQINLFAGIRLDRYYYDTVEENENFEISSRLYYHPMAMLNWHPNDSMSILLGIPDIGISIKSGEKIRAEIRASISKKAECSFRIRPFDRTNIALRFINIPYMEVPAKAIKSASGDPLSRRLSFVKRGIHLEAGRELNPAAVASLSFQYGSNSETDFRNNDDKNVITLNGKNSYAIGMTFTVDIEALFQVK